MALGMLMLFEELTDVSGGQALYPDRLGECHTLLLLNNLALPMLPATAVQRSTVWIAVDFPFVRQN